MNGNGKKGGAFMAGALTGAAAGAGLAAALNNRSVQAAPAGDEIVKLDYIAALGEEANEKLQQLLDAFRGFSTPQVSIPGMDAVTTLLKAQFFTDPEAACSLINAHQPNLVRGAPAQVALTLAPGATTVLASPISIGFVHLFTTADFYTDVPMAISVVLLMDGKLWYADTGLVPISGYKWRNWQETTSQWVATLTNNALVNVNIHAYLGGWDIEAETFNKIKTAIRPISSALAQYGSPELTS